MLFNLYIRKATKEFRIEKEKGNKIGRETVSDLRFADVMDF